MAKQLKVTWQDGGWNRDGDQPVTSVSIPSTASVRAVGEDTLVFDAAGASGRIQLVIPAARLISAVLVDVEVPANG